MQIWVDADATPGVVKEMLFRAAVRKQIPLTLVANKLLRVPPSPSFVRFKCLVASTWLTTRLLNPWQRGIL